MLTKLRSLDVGTQKTFKVNSQILFPIRNSQLRSLSLIRNATHPGDRLQTIYQLENSTEGWDYEWSVTQG